ncbi:MAG: hypothetical protein V1792_16790 [Pseudomonadota bacterium]
MTYSWKKASTTLLLDSHSRLFLLAGMSTLPLFCAAFIFIFQAGLPDRCLDIDMSMLELYTIHASHGEQYLGPYSRFGWNHPGPSYFYVMAPLYRLSGQCASSLFLTARIINLISFTFLAFIVAGTARKDDRILAIWTIVLLTFYLDRLGPDLLGNPWNPWIVILPFGVFVFSLASFSTGRIAFLPVIVFSGSFLVQTHVGTVPCVLALCATSLALIIVFSGWTGSRPYYVFRAGNGAWIGLSIVLAAVMWTLPLLEEMRHRPGNFSKLISFFWSTSGGNTFFDAFPIIAKQVAWFPSYLLKKMPVAIPAFEYDLLAEFFTVVQMVSLPFVFRNAVTKGFRFRACLTALGGVGVLAGMWSVLRIQGDVFPYLISWMSAIGLANWAVIGTACIEYVDGKLRVHDTWKRVRSRAAEVIAVIAVTAMVAMLIPGFVQVSRRPVAESLKVRMLSRTLISYLRENDVKRPVIHFDWSQWSVEAGVIVQIRKSGLDFAVKNTRSKHQENWPLLFPASYGPRGRDEKHIVFGTSLLKSDPRAVHIGGYGETHIYLWRDK